MPALVQRRGKEMARKVPAAQAADPGQAAFRASPGLVPPGTERNLAALEMDLVRAALDPGQDLVTV